MKKGNVYKINEKYVYITDGDYEINGRVSNAFSGRYVNQDGTLSNEKWAGYGANYPQIKHEIVVVIQHDQCQNMGRR